jgi:hypothetical protein
MHALYQRLRELDWDTFQRLAFQLLSEKHPGLKIRHVEGAGGDRGLDLFQGELKTHPAIWQCKHFPNGLSPKQRPQVKESLRVALKYFKPAQWILVVSVDLDRKGHEWFQKLQGAYSDQTSIGLFQASDVVRELIYRRNIREAFFPGAVFDTITVRRAIGGLAEQTSEQIAGAAAENLDELIARLEEADGRFNYQILYGPNVGMAIATKPSDNPLLLASVMDEGRRVDVFARDIDALRLDPPKINFSIKGSGVAKFQQFLRTGQRQEFETEEVSNPTSSFDFLLPPKDATAWKLVLTPSAAITRKSLDLRVTFASGAEQVRYELVKFRIAAAGTEQVQIESTSPLPFVLSFDLALVAGSEGNFNVQERFEGADVRAVAKAIRAMALLRTGGTVELFALEAEKTLGSLSVTKSAGHERQTWEAAVLDAAEVSEIYNVDLRLPATIKAGDLHAIAILAAIGKGESLPFESLSAGLVKTKEHEEAALSSAIQKMQVIAQFPRLDPPPTIFGTEVDTGPISILAKEAIVEGPDDFVSRYKNAAYGEGVPVKYLLKEVRAQLGLVDSSFSILAQPLSSSV